MSSATFFYPQWTSVETKGKETWSGFNPVDVHYPVYAGAEINTGNNSGMIFESNDGLNWNYVEVDEKINAIASNDLWTTNNFAGTPTNLLRNTFAIGNNGYLLRNSEATGNASISTNEDIDILETLINKPAGTNKETKAAKLYFERVGSPIQGLMNIAYDIVYAKEKFRQEGKQKNPEDIAEDVNSGLLLNLAKNSESLQKVL